MTIGNRKIRKGDVISVHLVMFPFRNSEIAVKFEINQRNEVIQIIIGEYLDPPVEIHEISHFINLLSLIDYQVKSRYAYQR